mmetsp:Transcript_46198/g.121984  ORF Transcript_46198/g.121984 Transcript_46198/m.121984 type:complete len:83 (+) Transcript_46198:520-768(+)
MTELKAMGLVTGVVSRDGGLRHGVLVLIEGSPAMRPVWSSSGKRGKEPSTMGSRGAACTRERSMLTHRVLSKVPLASARQHK